jgi:hypothetical protein
MGQITCYLSPLIPYVAAVRTVCSLLDLPRIDEALLYRFQKHSLHRERIHGFSKCEHFREENK